MGPVRFNFIWAITQDQTWHLAIKDLLNGFAVTFNFEVIYHAARGTIIIEAKSEGMSSHKLLC